MKIQSKTVDVSYAGLEWRLTGDYTFDDYGSDAGEFYAQVVELYADKTSSTRINVTELIAILGEFFAKGLDIAAAKALDAARFAKPGDTAYLFSLRNKEI